MDKSLQIQVELHREGEKIFLKILKKIRNIQETRKLEYLLATEININISDTRIWIYAVIGDESVRELCTISNFDNPYQSRTVAKEALIFYFLNSEYSYTISEEDVSEKDRRTIFKFLPF